MAIIIGIIIVAAAIVAMKMLNIKIIPIIAMVLGVVVMCFSFITSVPTGFTGVLTTLGRVEENITLEAGINFKLPWQKIVMLDNREQRSTFEFNAFSSDIQQTEVSGSVNYRINPSAAMTLYKSVGTNYKDTLIAPRLVENVKIVLGRYDAEELISKRDILADEVLVLLKEDLQDYGINIISISIEDIDFTDAFTDAIEAKQVATQDKLRAQTAQEQATMEAEAEAARRKIQAEADAEVARVAADAEAYSITTKASAEAEANSKISASLTSELIDYVQANNWDGQLPTTYMGSNESVIPVIEKGVD